MGTGKSTIAYHLGKRMKRPVLDTDALVVEKAGLPITEIFFLHGEVAFRDIESEVLAELSATKNSVVATGGGIVVREGNLQLIRTLGFVVWLTAPEDEILQRVTRTKHRPLVREPNAAQVVHDLLTSRLPLYERAAHFTVDTSLDRPTRIATKILRAFKQR